MSLAGLGLRDLPVSAAAMLGLMAVLPHSKLLETRSPYVVWVLCELNLSALVKMDGI